MKCRAGRDDRSVFLSVQPYATGSWQDERIDWYVYTRIRCLTVS